MAITETAPGKAALTILEPALVAAHHLEWLDQEKHYRKITRVCRFDVNVWSLGMDCGHVRHKTQKERPTLERAICVECALNGLVKSKGGRAIVEAVERVIRGINA